MHARGRIRGLGGLANPAGLTPACLDENVSAADDESPWNVLRAQRGTSRGFVARTSTAMGFYYRRSINIGPFRINVGSGGVGYSVGGRGFRVGQSGSGRRYTTFSLPGTGIGYRSGCALFFVSLLGGVALAARELMVALA